MTVRKAESRDRDALGKLGAMLIRTHHAFDRDRFLAPMDGVEKHYGAFLAGFAESRDACVFVAERDGVVAGYIFGTLEPMDWMQLRGPAGVIQDIAVAEEARRSGVATELMAAAIQWLREHGAPQVVLSTATPNIAAQSLFHRLGFRDTMIEMTMEL